MAKKCKKLMSTYFESELFGHERGAFTGAVTRKKGKFELADGGTLFLDEVTELPLDLQVKLLRFLQEYTIERVGGLETISLDVRIIAATNRDINQEVREGRFREDLFYRLSVIPIHLPPLRERGEDIILIANAYLNRYAREFGKKIKGFTQEAVDRMMRYPWPGNVRELQNGERLEQKMIRSALARHAGNVTKAADELVISRASLYDLMRKYGIDPKDFK